jgi:hypothetical protein
MMDQRKFEAERLRLGIRGGWIEPSAAISWADREIAREQDPHPALIDVALAAHQPREELVALLSAMPGQVDPAAVMRRCLGDLLVRLNAEPELGSQVARYLYAAAAAGELPPDRFGHEPFALDDEFALAQQGIGTVADAQARLAAFLRRHGEPEPEPRVGLENR